MRITVLYFAHVRDITGKTQESVEIGSGGMDELRETLFSMYPGLRNLSNLLISVNNEYYSGLPLKNGDRVAFFPPVSGG
ncbi:MAG: MoaD/ThiS family protein [Ferroplasma sp.]|uniref:MoaD/ThiS family protein n=1 Tax=Ferroplasma sp. TaxID=2591003 RepID=UPI002815EF63|nr:MoaD/ThiS family protein [Ferroplasma sp.]WMT50964.1 MAG: MoaD/ThiS family protein [Ferroplasma sp.]